MPTESPLGIIHRSDPKAGLEILKRVTRECHGDANLMAKKLGISERSVRAYQVKHKELRALARECKLKAAKAELSGK